MKGKRKVCSSLNIYIKSYNRPFYLERCLRSIQKNVQGYNRIYVLDDGTLSKYLERLISNYPDVTFLYSGADDGKFQLVREQRFAEIRKRYRDPSSFWIENISKDEGQYFWLLEDDTWICQPIDLQATERVLTNSGTAILKVTWCIDGPDRIFSSQVYRSEVISNSCNVQYFVPHLRSLRDLYQVYGLALHIFGKQYWLNAVNDLRYFLDEDSQLRRVLNYIRRKDNRDILFAKTENRHLYWGWAIPGRSDPLYYRLGLKQHIFTDALNEAWLAGSLNVMDDFPRDIGIDHLLDIFSYSGIDKLQIDSYNIWRSSISLLATPYNEEDKLASDVTGHRE